MARRPRSHRGFTLVELSIAVTVMVLLGGIGFQILNGGMIQFARNISLNESSRQTRTTLSQVKRYFEQAVDNPQLVTMSGSPATLTVSTATYATGIRFHRFVSGAYKVTGPVGTTVGTAPNTLSYVNSTSLTVTLAFATATPAPIVGDRLLFLYPYITESTSGTSAGTKPGRVVSAVGVVTTSGGTKTVTVLLASTLGSNVLCGNPAYAVREAALITVDGGGRRELRYFDSTANLLAYAYLTRDLDATPTARDSGGTTMQPFKLVTDNTGQRVLSVQLDLPMRIMDYNATLTRLKATDEFNSYLRANVLIPVKNNNALK